MVHTLERIVHWKWRCSVYGGVLISLLCFVYVLLSYHIIHFTPAPFDHQFDDTRMERKNELIPVQGCNCSRRNHYIYRKDQNQTMRLISSCSDPGTFYEPSQKVVSYSLYFPKCVLHRECQDGKSFYIEGIHENLRAMRLYYPTYTMRVYTDVKTDPEICSIICNNSDLFWCDIRESPMHPNRNLSQVFFMIWRFLPLGDPTVDHFLSRDLDSILSEREAAVVAEWLSLPEKKAIHVMRDRNAHNAPMLGGMWGASNSLFGGSGNESAVSVLTSILNTGMNPGRQHKGFDQDVLSSVVFYPLKDKIVAYDSYGCEHWRRHTLVRPFPLKRENKFVGQPGLAKVNARPEKCPVECRPEHGKDWELC